jgi:hypothetical protein
VTSFLADISDSMEELDRLAGTKTPQSPLLSSPEFKTFPPVPQSAPFVAITAAAAGGELSDNDNGGDRDDATDLSDSGHGSPVREQANGPTGSGEDPRREEGEGGPARADDDQDDDDDKDSRERRLANLAKARLARMRSSEEEAEEEEELSKQKSDEFKLPVGSGRGGDTVEVKSEQSPPPAEKAEEMGQLNDSRTSGTEDYELSLEISEAEFR